MSTKDTEPDQAAYGWQSDLPTFYGTQPRVVRVRLEEFIRDAGTEQIRAWDASIPWLQRECRELVDAYSAARTYTAILEYELPRESRRPDVIILENGVVVVLELKGKDAPSQADIDQVFCYARDLRSYHVECADRPVHAVLVPTRAGRTPRTIDGVQVVGPEGVDRLLLRAGKTLVGLQHLIDGDSRLFSFAQRAQTWGHPLIEGAARLPQHRKAAMKPRALGMALIIAWCMTSPLCADNVKEKTLTLQFVPQESTGTSAPKLSGAMVKRAVSVTFEDARPPSEVAQVGEGTDDHDHLFPWHSSNSVMEFATEVFHRTADGWGIQESEGADVTLALRITRFYVTEKDQAVGSTYAADARVGFALKDRTGVVLADGVSAGSARRYGRKRSGENCNEVLSDAIKEAYAKLFDQPNLQAAWSGQHPTSTTQSNGAAQPAAGTAWFVGHRWLVTANHVVEGHSSLSVVFEGGTQLPARAITRDAANDVAILELDAEPPTTAGCLVLSSGALMMGQSVFTLGFPHPDIMGTAPKLTTGEISAEQGLKDDPRFYQISVPVQMGNSGGPLLSIRGEVAGLIVGKLSPLVMLERTGDLPENVNYALKADYIRPLLRNLSCQPPHPLPTQGDTDLSAVASRVRHAVTIVNAD